MATKTSLFLDDSQYLALYEGKGDFIFINQQKISCTFEIIQLKNGEIVLYCSFTSNFEAVSLHLKGEAIERFDGTTNQGFRLLSSGNIIVMNVHGEQATCILQQFSVEMAKDIQALTVHFGITNFLIDPTLPSQNKGFPLQLKHSNNVKKFQVKPIEGYMASIERLQIFKNVDVTCEVIGNIQQAKDRYDLEQAVDDLCYLFSIARGTKIEWIYQSFYSESGTCTLKIHASRVTKTYNSFSIIGGPPELQKFIEETYNSYVKNRERYRLNMGTIDTYLDAKSQGDYLQVRGIKLAVAMEVIKDVFINLPDAPIKEFIIDRHLFEKHTKILSKAILPILESANASFTKEIIHEKLQEFNRRAFRDVLGDIFQHIQFQIESDEKKYFIKCRNNLVHRGRFSCEDTKKAAPTLEQMVQEFHFLVSILDQVILKILGYKGIYLDRREPGHVVHKELT